MCGKQKASHRDNSQFNNIGKQTETIFQLALSRSLRVHSLLNSVVLLFSREAQSGFISDTH